MNITYKNPGYIYSLDSILLFLTGDQTPFWSESIFHFYPQLDKQTLSSLYLSDKQKYINDVLKDAYERLHKEIDSKVICYTNHFQKHKCQIEEALSEAFNLDAASIFNNLTANITLNPISPRFLKEQSFDVFYMNSEKGALGLSLHEVIHYFWFYVWNHHFDDSYDEYETPSLKWILSEMVVETIMSDERLSSLNPYFPKENGGCIYPYFQNMIVNGSPILDTIDDLYHTYNITDFMEEAYAYCLNHEKEIRRHIEVSENAF